MFTFQIIKKTGIIMTSSDFVTVNKMMNEISEMKLLNSVVPVPFSR